MLAAISTGARRVRTLAQEPERERTRTSRWDVALSRDGDKCEKQSPRPDDGSSRKRARSPQDYDSGRQHDGDRDRDRDRDRGKDGGKEGGAGEARVFSKSQVWLLCVRCAGDLVRSSSLG